MLNDAAHALVDGLELPEGLYAKVLTDQGRPMEVPPRIVVWPDRPYAVCPSCSQEIDISRDCPVVLSNDQMDEVSQQHGCGQWLSAPWRDVRLSGPEDVTADEVLQAVAQVTEEAMEKAQEQRARVRKAVRQMLTEGLARLAEPLAPDETPEERRDEVDSADSGLPGLCWQDGVWLAWDWDPDGSGALIEVREGDVAAAQATRQDG